MRHKNVPRDRQLGDALKDEPHPFAHGLRVNGNLRPTNSEASGALPWIYLQEIECPKQMLWLALLGAQAALLQHIPHYIDNLHLRAEEAAELVILHSDHSNFSGHLVHNVLGVQENHINVAYIIVAHVVVIVIVACVVIINIVACVIDDITHFLFVVLAVKDGSGGRSCGCGNRFTHLVCLFCVCGGCVLWLKSVRTN